MPHGLPLCEVWSLFCESSPCAAKSKPELLSARMSEGVHYRLLRLPLLEVLRHRVGGPHRTLNQPSAFALAELKLEFVNSRRSQMHIGQIKAHGVQ